MRPTGFNIHQLLLEFPADAVILYGSRAMGTFTAQSDIDILFIRTGAPERRTERWNGFWLDAFFDNEQVFSRPKDYLHLRHGMVLKEQQNEATQWLAAIRAYWNGGPPPLSALERQVRIHWFLRTLERIQPSTPEAHYRRAWLLMDLLPAAFELQGRWYPGSKEAFLFLAEHEPMLYQRFSKALQPEASFEAIFDLVHMIAQPHPFEATKLVAPMKES